MKRVTYSFIIALFITFLYACHHNNDNYKTFLPSQLINNYHQTYNKQSALPDNNFNVYLDYSSGMKIAFSNPETMNFYSLFINSLKISQVNFYSVDRFDITKIENLDKNELYQKIKDAGKFSGINAPLGKAVTQICDLNSESVFITDGELWDNSERNDPWAREDFEKWLVKGNTIKFFITDFSEAGKKKHLFFIFFIPRNISAEQSPASMFEYYLKNSVEAKNVKYSAYSFSNSDIVFSNDYQNRNAGVNENAGLDETDRYIGENFEYLSLMSKWKDLFKYIAQGCDNNGNPVKGGLPLLNKLYLKSNLDFYSIKALDLKVYDITADFAEFNLINEISANPPVFAQDENGKPITDDAGNKVVASQGHYEGYDQYGRLIHDTIFKPGKLTPVENLFTLNQNEFLKIFASENSGQICIHFNENPVTDYLSTQNYNFFKVEIVLKDVTCRTDKLISSDFIWQGKQVAQNAGLYNSILGALQAANPKNKTVYTFYINTLPYK